jgi:hypothetical protein
MDGGGIRFGGRTPRRHRHVWAILSSSVGESFADGVLQGDVFLRIDGGPRGEICRVCGRVKDPTTSRRGRNNAKRGKLYEREWCRRLGLRQTGGLNKEDDGLNDVFVGQAKSMASARFPSWMSRALDILRARWPDRIPILGILEAPGAARDHKPKRLIVIDEQDWRDLHVGTEETTDD